MESDEAVLESETDSQVKDCLLQAPASMEETIAVETMAVCEKESEEIDKDEPMDQHQELQIAIVDSSANNNGDNADISAIRSKEGDKEQEVVGECNDNLSGNEACNNEGKEESMEDVTEEKVQTVVEEENQDVENSVAEEDTTTTPSYYFWKYELVPEFSPKFLIGSTKDEFKGTKCAKFLKGCKWAPDGSCILSCSDDDNLRLFNFPSCFSSVQDWYSSDSLPGAESEMWSSALKIKEGGLIYDFCWYPLMSSMDPVSSCFLSTSSEAPIHLWDAFTGKLRASYQPFNHLEQLVAARSLAFDPTGETIYSGYEKCIRIFSITRPGKQCVERPLKQENAELNQYGIVGSVCVNPTMKSFYAVGSFDKTVGLYYEDGSVVCLLQGHSGGVTHLKFSNDGMKLFSGGRNDSRLICWDMRKMGEAYKIFDRKVTTHQRIYFDVTADDRYLVTGGTDGIVKVWEISSEGNEPLFTFRANTDCVNGISCNPYIPILATSSGQRHFFEIASDSDDDEFFVKSESSRERSCDIKLWKLA